jgi:hypothetical protein
MRYLIGIGVLVAVAIALRVLVSALLVHTGRTVDISIDNVLRPVPLSAVIFWFLIGIACVWFPNVTYIRYVTRQL